MAQKWVAGTYSPMPTSTRFGVSTITPFTGNYFTPQKTTSKKKSTKTKEKEKKTSYNFDGSILAGLPQGSSGGSGGSGGGGGGIDISGLLAAYDQQADASRKIAQNTYDTTRNDLLTSLKRFQEQNAKDVQNQKQSYLTEQSSLDYAREQANRQNRVAASARGLGGSGLQQLAQLQTLMNQSEEVSQAATSNQKAMDTLRQALQQKEEDTNSNLAKAQTTLDNALTKIEANLAQQKAEAMLQSRGGGSGGSGGGGGSYDDGFDASLANLLDSYNAELGSLAGKTDAEVKKYVKEKYGDTYGTPKYMSDVRTILNRVYTDNLGNYAGKMSNATYSTAKNTVNNMVSNLKGQGKKKTKKKKFLGLF